jgi:hypothetical protein
MKPKTTVLLKRVEERAPARGFKIPARKYKHGQRPIPDLERAGFNEDKFVEVMARHISLFAKTA